MSRPPIPETKRTLRRDRAAWQRAAIGLLGLAAVGNMALGGLLVREHRTAAYWEDRYNRSESVRSAALTACGLLRQELDKQAAALEETKARAAGLDAYEAVESCRYICQFKLTAYCCEKYPHICGAGDGLTDTGLEVRPGIVAVDPEVIPLGSTVVIGGARYLAADTGDAVRGNHVDIAVEKHADALAFGVKYADVWVILPEEEP